MPSHLDDLGPRCMVRPWHCATVNPCLCRASVDFLTVSQPTSAANYLYPILLMFPAASCFCTNTQLENFKFRSDARPLMPSVELRRSLPFVAQLVVATLEYSFDAR